MSNLISRFYATVVPCVVFIASCGLQDHTRSALAGGHFAPEDKNDAALPSLSLLFSENFLPSVTLQDKVILHFAYSLCYSETHEQAIWVAYRLTRRMCRDKQAERKNNFRPDPFVITESASPKDYLKSGYDKGHLCPAQDMAWSKIAMSESFFMSNISPQAPSFNRGTWKSLEMKVRTWAEAVDTIYIVTGGVLVDDLIKIGTNEVSVPRLFFKVILQNPTSGKRGIGFVMDNRRLDPNVFSYAVSIDSVEALTGIDFFPALRDDIERRIEAVRTMDWK